MPDGRRRLARPLVRSPTLQTLVAFLAVFAVQLVTGLVGAMAFLFVLDPTVIARPWSLVASIYAHDGAAHLLANAVGLLVCGLLVERRTTRFRFHAFFVAAGATAGLAEVVFGGLLGGARGVLGASGAIFALAGYLLAGNVVSETLLDRLSRRVQLLAFVVLAAVVTVATGAPGVALVAHFTGLVFGLLAGRRRLLDVERSRNRSYK